MDQTDFLIGNNISGQCQFCNLPCNDPFQQAIEQNLPPARSNPPPDPNTPIFQNSTNNRIQIQDDNHTAFHGRTGANNLQSRYDILDPPYMINNAAGPLSSRTAFVSSFSGHWRGKVLTSRSRRMQSTQMDFRSTIPTTSTGQWCPALREQRCWPADLESALLSSLARRLLALVPMLGNGSGIILARGINIGFLSLGCSILLRYFKCLWSAVMSADSVRHFVTHSQFR